MTADLKINAFGGRNSGSRTCEIRRDRLRLSPRNKASWCNGSTRDSGSLCLGSNPSEAERELPIPTGDADLGQIERAPDRHRELSVHSLHIIPLDASDRI